MLLVFLVEETRPERGESIPPKKLQLSLLILLDWFLPIAYNSYLRRGHQVENIY